MLSVAKHERPADGDDAARDDGTSAGVSSGGVAPESLREELARRAARARAEKESRDYAGLADEIHRNTEALAAHEASLAALHELMRETVKAAGLAPPEVRTRHLRVVRDGEAI